MAEINLNFVNCPVRMGVYLMAFRDRVKVERCGNLAISRILSAEGCASFTMYIGAIWESSSQT